MHIEGRPTRPVLPAALAASGVCAPWLCGPIVLEVHPDVVASQLVAVHASDAEQLFVQPPLKVALVSVEWA